MLALHHHGFKPSGNFLLRHMTCQKLGMLRNFGYTLMTPLSRALAAKRGSRRRRFAERYNL